METTNIPVYQMLMSEDIDDMTGVSIVSFVKSPAIKVNFVTLSDEETKPKAIKLSAVDSVKRIVMGPVLIPNLPMYREPDDENPEGYYIVYSPEVIEQVALKIFKTHRNNNVDTDHNGILMAGVTCFESFQSNFARGFYPPTDYSALPDRTLYQSYKLENDELYNACLDGTFQGLSITGLFSMKEIKLTAQQAAEQAYERVTKLLKGF